MEEALTSSNVRLPLSVNLIASAAMLAVAYDRAFNCALEFYPSTTPTMAQAGLAGLVAVIGLVFRRGGMFCLFISSMLLGTLLIPALYARFPGGDDGGGLGWLFMVGGGSVISFFVAIVTAMMGSSIQSRSSQTAAANKHPAASPTSGSLPPVSRGKADSASRQDEKRARPWLWGILGTLGLLFVWLVAGPITWRTTRTEHYGGGTELRRVDLHELMPFLYHVARDHQKILLINGEEVKRAPSYTDLHPSPTGRYIVVADRGLNEAIQVYSTAGRSSIELAVEKNEFPQHYYVYPFRFLRWDGDGSFLLEVTGATSDYPQTWRVAASTGERSRIE